MSQYDYIKDIAKFALANDNMQLIKTLYALIDYAQQINKHNFALQLQSIIKEAQRKENVSVRLHKFIDDNELNDIIIENFYSDYSLNNLVCSRHIKKELEYFIKERNSDELLIKEGLPLSNKIMFYGPSGCGKTLAAYVLAGELNRPLTTINLGAIVSSKLGETSKNLSKVFRKAAFEGSIIFLDEFDSLGKLRDYDQDHGEMKRVVNTLLQLFDFLDKDCIIIAATNQIQVIDDALLRRFDIALKFDYPTKSQIKELIYKTLQNKDYNFDDETKLEMIIDQCKNISFYTIKKTLLTTIKRTILDNPANSSNILIDTSTWQELISIEKKRAVHN